MTLFQTLDISDFRQENSRVKSVNHIGFIFRGGVSVSHVSNQRGKSNPEIYVSQGDQEAISSPSAMKYSRGNRGSIKKGIGRKRGGERERN